LKIGLRREHRPKTAPTRPSRRLVAPDAVEARSNAARTRRERTIEACAAACRACGDECARHAAHHEHCRLCAEACRRCDKACEDLLATIA